MDFLSCLWIDVLKEIPDEDDLPWMDVSPVITGKNFLYLG
jgi:hypothetical protein